MKKHFIKSMLKLVQIETEANEANKYYWETEAAVERENLMWQALEKLQPHRDFEALAHKANYEERLLIIRQYLLIEE